MKDLLLQIKATSINLACWFYRSSTAYWTKQYVLLFVFDALKINVQHFKSTHNANLKKLQMCKCILWTKLSVIFALWCFADWGVENEKSDRKWKWKFNVEISTTFHVKMIFDLDFLADPSTEQVSRFPCSVLSYFSLVIVVEHWRRWWLHRGGSRMHFKGEIASLQKWPFLAGFGLFWTHFVCMWLIYMGKPCIFCKEIVSRCLFPAAGRLQTFYHPL